MGSDWLLVESLQPQIRANRSTARIKISSR